MNESSSDECQYFYEDEVYRYNDKTGKIQFGLVLENSEYASSEEDSESENEGHKLKRGQVRVSWYPTGKESVVSEKKVFLADRSLMPGDVVVRKENNCEKKCGYCRQVKTVASVQIVGTDLYLCNINSEDLHPMEDFSPDIAVTLDHWVGMSRSVKFKVFLRTKDGSLCIMDDHQAIELRSPHDKCSRDSEFRRDEFYPGQVLTGRLSQFEGVIWLEGGPEKILAESTLKLHKKIQVVAQVEKVEVVSLGVQWQCQSWIGNDTNATPAEQPKFTIDGEDLKRVKMLNVFEPCTLQLGDKSFYRYKASDVILTAKEWNHLQKKTLFPQHAKKCSGSRNIDDDEWESEETDESQGDEKIVSAHLSETESCSSSRGSQGKTRSKPSNSFLTVSTRTLKKRKLRLAKSKSRTTTAVVAVKPGDKLVVETLATSSWVDVVWQDGTTDEGIPSRLLYPVHHLDDKEFFPGDFVVQADSNTSTTLLDYGVVQCVNAQARTAFVQWFQTCTKFDWIKPEPLSVTEVSVYDLKDHPDFKFRPGSIVVRVAASCESSSLGSAGQVLDNHPSGQVEVWWAEGCTTRCWPQELYRVGDYDSDAGELWDDHDFPVEDDDEQEDEGSQGSWETESEISVEVEEEDKVIVKSPYGTRSHPAHLQRLFTNLEKARSALHRLESLLYHARDQGNLTSPHTTEVLKLLLEVYKQCRYLDRLMGTSFFHERNFEGLLEKVREDGRQESFNRLSNHIRRLFSYNEVSSSLAGPSVNVNDCQESSKRSANAEGEAEVLLHVMNVVQQMCENNDLQPCRTSYVPVDHHGFVESSSSSVTVQGQQDQQLQLLHVCLRLGQLLGSQLMQAQEEMNRRRGLKLSNTSIKEQEVGQLLVEKEEEKLQDDDLNDNDQCPAPDKLFPITRGSFIVMDTVPSSHKFVNNISHPADPKMFQKALRQELTVLRSSLPEGIHVKTFEDRMDLFSVLIEGPSKTPYEGGLFLFDFQLPNDYPRTPPLCHYWSYCTERLNPNLYEEGKVCVSLLGTWSGKGSEIWGPGSNLLQVLVSIQGLILVSEPYYNEAGYERQRGNPQARENSRLYNEMVLLKMLQAMSRLVQHPPEIWKTEIVDFVGREGPSLLSRYLRWMKMSEAYLTNKDSSVVGHGPDFPLVPASKGFCLTLRKALQEFEHLLNSTLRTPNSSPNLSLLQIQNQDSVSSSHSTSAEEANLSR